MLQFRVCRQYAQLMELKWHLYYQKRKGPKFTTYSMCNRPEGLPTVALTQVGSVSIHILG